MDQIRLTPQEAWLYTVLIGAGFGLVLGLIPLVVGIVKGKAKLGAIGLVASIACGAILGILLALPAAAIFVWLIVKRPAAPASDTNVPAE
jgi:hypothetical protein